MALLLETNLGGDVVIDLDLDGSPLLCQSFLKLAKIRYFTSHLFFNVQPHRFCQSGDPTGTGKGGACIAGVLDKEDEESSQKRFLKSSAGRRLSPSQCRQRGRVVCTNLLGTNDTIGSQFLIILGDGEEGQGLDGYLTGEDDFVLSLGVVTEDDGNVLQKLERAYCDAEGRPYVDIRIMRMLVLHDPFDDPPGLDEYLHRVLGIKFDAQDRIIDSPNPSRPRKETVPERVAADQVDATAEEETEEQARKRRETEARQQDHQRAVVLELLGDLPSAEAKAPDNVLFVCKLNSITQDEDLELIFSRFDPNCKAEIIRDNETGASLQYAFVEFATKDQCVEAYFKMNNALVDDRRIKVDFSQSVAKLWNRHAKKMKPLPYQAQRGEGRGESHGGFGRSRQESHQHERDGRRHESDQRRDASHHYDRHGHNEDRHHRHGRENRHRDYEDSQRKRHRPEDEPQDDERRRDDDERRRRKHDKGERHRDSDRRRDYSSGDEKERKRRKEERRRDDEVRRREKHEKRRSHPEGDDDWRRERKRHRHDSDEEDNRRHRARHDDDDHRKEKAHHRELHGHSSHRERHHREGRP